MTKVLANACAQKAMIWEFSHPGARWFDDVVLSKSHFSHMLESPEKVL